MGKYHELIKRGRIQGSGVPFYLTKNKIMIEQITLEELISLKVRRLTQNDFFTSVYKYLFLEVLNGKNDCDVRLVGGAVIDSIDDKKPKDWDVITTSAYKYQKLKKRLNKCARARYKRETATALTYDIILPTGVQIEFQLLKRYDMKAFPFTAQQSYVKINQEQLYPESILLHEDVGRRVLVPTDFTKKKSAINQLLCTPKYLEKGFTIDPIVWKRIVSMSTKQESLIYSSES